MNFEKSTKIVEILDRLIRMIILDVENEDVGYRIDVENIKSELATEISNLAED